MEHDDASMRTAQIGWLREGWRLLTMMLTLPGKLDLVYKSAAGMRNRFSELEYRSDEHPSRTVRRAGTWLKERVPWGRDMGGGLGRDETHDTPRRMELQPASLISTETRKI